MWVAMVVREFDVEPVGPPYFPVTVELNFKPMVGYLGVYDTKEEAEKDSPGYPLIEVQEIPKQPCAPS